MRLKIFLAFTLVLMSCNVMAQKRIYLANDEHTDYFWTNDDVAYRGAFIDMLDFYLALADTTAGNPTDFQSRFFADGSLWFYEYQHNKTSAEWNNLLAHWRSGHIRAAMNPLVILYGGSPAEAALRSMYYAGALERRYGLDFNLAISMENQAMPWGLASLWAGSGVKYSWKGVCNCASQISAPGNREHSMYWYTGPDGQRILFKWYPLLNDSQSIGGYAEAYYPSTVIPNFVNSVPFNNAIPYTVTGVFGFGWDRFQTTTNEFVTTAQAQSNGLQRVIVSNQEDFFTDFEQTYGNGLPSEAYSYGNEWELYSASMPEVSARVKRSLEKLRAAEALAAILSQYQPSILDGRADARIKAFLDFGLYWEHDWTGDGIVARTTRANWQRTLVGEIEAYVNSLYDDSAQALAKLIPEPTGTRRYYVFNPLGWSRSDYADLPYSDLAPIHVVVAGTSTELPSQRVTVGGQAFLRVWVDNIPAVGYRVLEIASGAGATFSAAATVNNTIIDNANYQITFSPRGAITSWIDKQHSNRELANTIGGRNLNDLGAGAGGDTLSVENSGPVSVTLLATSSAPYAHTTRLTLDLGGIRIALENRISQGFGSALPTWGYAFNLSSPNVHHEEVGAIIDARLNTVGGNYASRQMRYDWLTLNHYADIGQANASVGAVLSNWDTLFFQLGNSTTSSLDTSRAIIKPLVGGQVDGTSLGIQNQGGDTNFLQRFALTARTSYSAVNAMKFALEHQNPLIAKELTSDGNRLPADQFSALTISDPNVLLWAFKPAEEGTNQGLIARLWNLSAQAVTTNLSLAPFSIRSANETTHVETDGASLPVNAGSISLNFATQQIKTVRLRNSDLIFMNGLESDGW